MSGSVARDVPGEIVYDGKRTETPRVASTISVASEMTVSHRALRDQSLGRASTGP